MNQAEFEVLEKKVQQFLDESSFISKVEVADLNGEPFPLMTIEKGLGQVVLDSFLDWIYEREVNRKKKKNQQIDERLREAAFSTNKIIN